MEFGGQLAWIKSYEKNQEYTATPFRTRYHVVNRKYLLQNLSFCYTEVQPFSVPYCPCTNPRRLTYVWWRLIFVVFSTKFAACHPSGAYNFEVAPRLLEHLFTHGSYK
jgi:hypothetical protein